MFRDDSALIEILRAARLASEFRGRLERESFLTDIKTQAAVLHELLVLARRGHQAPVRGVQGRAC